MISYSGQGFNDGIISTALEKIDSPERVLLRTMNVQFRDDAQGAFRADQQILEVKPGIVFVILRP